MTAIALAHFTVICLSGAPFTLVMLPQLIAACAGLLLLIGLWTPVMGFAIAAIELWMAFTRSGDPWLPVILATLGVAVAMVGPGAWSIDARLFGRRHIGS